MRELELKFQVPAELVRSLLHELRRHGGRSTRLLGLYFDTRGGLLAGHGLSLRLRKQGPRWLQTLKTEGDSPVDRIEHEVQVATARGGASVPPALDIARHDDSAAGARLRELLASAAHADGAAAALLVERCSSAIGRLACRLPLAGAEIELAFDVGVLRAGAREATVCELEFEHKSGEAGVVFDLARSWRAHGGLWLDTRSKFQRGSVLARSLSHGPPVKARAPRLDDSMDGAQLLRSVVAACLDQVLANASELAAGSSDEDHVHQLRVGLRRLRTALRELKSLAGDIDALSWEPPLVAAFSRLGALRDEAAVARAVKPLLQQAGAPRVQWQPTAEQVDVGLIVRDADFQDTLLDLLRWVTVPPPRSDSEPDAAQARRLVAQRLSKLHKAVVRSAKRFEALPLEEQHGVRKTLKRLRYLAEFVAALWPAAAVQAYLRPLSPAQDALGRHNDVAVAAERFRQDALDHPQSLFAAGFLQAHLRSTARDAHETLRGIAKAPRFWKK